MLYNFRFKSMVLVGLGASALALMAGCSSLKNDSTAEFVVNENVIEGHANDHYSLTINSITSGNVFFTQTKAYYNGKTLSVRGKIRNRYITSVAGGHVDIKIFSPNNTEIHNSSTYQVPRTIRNLSRRKGAKFSMLIEKEIPNGSTVELRFHRPKKVAAISPH